MISTEREGTLSIYLDSLRGRSGLFRLPLFGNTLTPHILAGRQGIPTLTYLFRKHPPCRNLVRSFKNIISHPRGPLISIGKGQIQNTGVTLEIPIVKIGIIIFEPVYRAGLQPFLDVINQRHHRGYRIILSDP